MSFINRTSVVACVLSQICSQTNEWQSHEFLGECSSHLSSRILFHGATLQVTKRSTTERSDRMSSVPAFRIPFLKSRLTGRVSRQPFSICFPTPSRQTLFLCLKTSLEYFLPHLFHVTYYLHIRCYITEVTKCRDQSACWAVNSRQPVTFLPLMEREGWRRWT